MNVGIVGAGFAGTAAAVFLARGGHRVTLYERAEVPGPVGAAIILQPTGLAILGRLGLADAVCARATRLSGLKVVSPRGRRIVDLSYDALDPTWFGIGVHRGVLFESLIASVHGAGVTVRTGVDVDGLGRDGDGRWVLSADVRHGPHDLVIVADGTRSRIAGLVAPRRVKPYPWGALWFVGPDPGGVAHLRQVARGNRTFLGVLPTGLGPCAGAMTPPTTPLATLFWSVRADRVDALRRNFAAWCKDVLALAPYAEPLVAAIPDPSALLFSSYADVRMARLHDADTVVIGDAAHAMSPQLGQGTNLALWDALALADALADPTRPLAAQLAAFAETRRRSLRFYQRATRWLTPLFQSDRAWLGWLRDALFPLGTRLPPVRRLMTASLAGVASGFWGAREALPASWPPGPPREEGNAT